MLGFLERTCNISSSLSSINIAASGTTLSISYSPINLIEGVPHIQQLQFVREWDIPTGVTFSREELFRLKCIDPTWVTLNETTKQVTAITVPANTQVSTEEAGLVDIPAWVDGQTLTIYRYTDIDEPLVEWGAGTRWTASQFNLEVSQLIHSLQEISWRLNNEVIDIRSSEANDGPYWQPGDLDMMGYNIINLGQPDGENDAVPLSYLEDNYLHKVNDREVVDGWVGLDGDLLIPAQFLPDLSELGGAWFYQAEAPSTDNPDGSMWVDSDNHNVALLIEGAWVTVFSPSDPVELNTVTYCQTTAPTDALEGGGDPIPAGSTWFNTSTEADHGGGRFFRRIEDSDAPDSGYWVDMSGVDGNAGTLNATVAATAPSSPVNGQLWWSTAETKLYCYTTGDGWVEA